ncbi:MAG: FG-GAP-like repeat-containing protein [Chthonomonadales bacterium]
MLTISHSNRIMAVAGIGLLTIAITGCPNSKPVAPKTGTPEYGKIISTFFKSVAALDAGDVKNSPVFLEDLTKLAPNEPAAWANLGLYQLRSSQLVPAAASLKKAMDLSPDNKDVILLQALLESRQGKGAECVAHLKAVVNQDPTNLRAQFALYSEIGRLGGPDAEKQAAPYLTQVLNRRPENIFAILEQAHVAAKSNDQALLASAMSALEKHSSTWNERAKTLLKEAKTATGVTLNTTLLRIGNMLLNEHEYLDGMQELKGDDKSVGAPLTAMLTIPSPPQTPAAADMTTKFTPAPLDVDPKIDWSFAAPVVLSPELEPLKAAKFKVPAQAESTGDLIYMSSTVMQVKQASGKMQTLPFPGKSASRVLPRNLMVADLNYDFRMDITVGGDAGLILYRQQTDGSFKDATSKAGIKPELTSAPIFGVWAFDVDLDGDLDIVVSPKTGPVYVLRNNSNGTFVDLRPFGNVESVISFAAADVDGDGDPDVALVDGKGQLHIFRNDRGGKYTELPKVENMTNVTAVAAADLDHDSGMDFIVLTSNNQLVQISDIGRGTPYRRVDLANFTLPKSEVKSPGTASILVADLDNNGCSDIVVTSNGSSICYLGKDSNGLFLLPGNIPGRIDYIDEFSSDARQSLYGFGDGKPAKFLNSGSAKYNWTVMRPRADYNAPPADGKPAGDQRINAFGVGAEMEVRAGLLYQKVLVRGSSVHFGLGSQPEIDLTRIVWPNGSVQAEFDQKKNGAVIVDQRLKGSCPWLFAWNGKEMEFVTDFIWRSPLGLKINAQVTPDVMTTEDWVKIRGDQLVPRDGKYDVRITADLWETHFFDHVSLMTVDHPLGTEMYIDERFAFPPPTFKFYITGKPVPVTRAVEDNGNDVTKIIAARDGSYLDNFGRGDYQGITRDHYVDIDIPVIKPATGPLYLKAFGWIHPTDTSINIAISQGHHVTPKALSLDVADGKDGWKVAIPNLGFPSGKNKTILIPLDGVFVSGAPRKVRLRTNLEIFWDEINVVTTEPNIKPAVQRLNPEVADLHYRGFSEVQQENISSPEHPVYSSLAQSGQKWRDLEGYYTRYGDVRELLKSVDDRYVIMNAGDEISFKFAAPALPPAGMVRDFVLVGDGWVKDGDYNTAFGKTVLPLPTHSNAKYNGPLTTLENDPVYKKHAADWDNFHTRWVDPTAFRNALRGSIR